MNPDEIWSQYSAEQLAEYFIKEIKRSGKERISRFLQTYKLKDTRKANEVIRLLVDQWKYFDDRGNPLFNDYIDIERDRR